MLSVGLDVNSTAYVNTGFANMVHQYQPTHTTMDPGTGLNQSGFIGNYEFLTLTLSLTLGKGTKTFQLPSLELTGYLIFWNYFTTSWSALVFVLDCPHVQFFIDNIPPQAACPPLPCLNNYAKGAIK